MQLTGKDLPLTKEQVQAFIESKQAEEFIGCAGDGEICLLARAWGFYHPGDEIMVNYDLITVNGDDYYFKAWQKGLARRLDLLWGDQLVTRQQFEERGGMDALAKRYTPPGRIAQ